MVMLTDQLTKFNDEVYYLSGTLCGINEQYFSFLSTQAKLNERHRCRICIHSHPDDVLHEMFILHRKGNYVPPHAHSNSDESLTLIKGEGAMFYYDNNGELLNIVYLHADSNKGSNYVRTPKGVFHSLYIISDEFIFKEVVQGPFERTNMIAAHFAPKEGEDEKITEFLKCCQQQLNRVEKHDC